MKELKVGDKVWYVSKFSRSKEVVVESIGRKWVNLSNRTRMTKDGIVEKDYTGTSIGTVYESEEAFNEFVKVSAEWQSLKRQIEQMNGPPEFATVEKIDALRAYLGLKEKK